MTPRPESTDMLQIERHARAYPRVFEVLSRAGWSASRTTELPEGFEDLLAGHGYYLFDHPYATAFLRAFGGLSINVASPRGTGRRGFDIAPAPAADRMLTSLDLAANFLFIEKLAGSKTLFPIMTAGGDVVFARPDGHAMGLEQTYQGVVRATDPFALMHWYLFDEATPNVEVTAIPNDERPIRFRWR